MKPRSKQVEAETPAGTRKSRTSYGEAGSRATKAKGSLSPGEATASEPGSGGAGGLFSNEEIAARAHEIWLREGRPHGRDRDHWFQAEEELKRERKGGA